MRPSTRRLLNFVAGALAVSLVAVAPPAAAAPTPVPLPSRTAAARAVAAAPASAAPGFLTAGGGVTSPPVSAGNHLYVSTGSTIAAWDMSGRVLRGPVRTGADPEAGSISGLVASHGFLYAATLAYAPSPDTSIEGGGISTYALDDPSAPHRVLHLDLPDALGYASTPHSIAAAGDTLFVVDQYGGVFSYGLSDPQHPTFLGAVAYETNFFAFLNQASSATVVGRHLILTGFNDGESGRYITVLVYDISDPAKPVFAGYRELDGPGFGPAFAESNALVVTPEGYGFLFGFRLAVFDLRDPKNITMVSGSSYPHAQVTGAAAVVRGRYAYVATQPLCTFGNCGQGRRVGTDVWDLADPAHPRLVRALPVTLSPDDYNGAADSPFGPVFVGADDSVRVLDLTRPTAPTLRYRLPLLTSGGRVSTLATKAVFDNNGLAYVVGGSHGFSVVDPHTLEPVARFDSDPHPELTVPADATDIALKGRRAYLLDDQGLSVVDVGIRARPRLLAHVDLPASEGVGKVAVDGRHAYVATSTTLRTYDVSRDRSPRLVSTFPGLYGVDGIAIRGNHLFVTAGLPDQSGVRLLVLDVTQASAPALLSSSVGCAANVLGGEGLAVSARGDRAYVTAPGCGRVDVFDTSDPAAPRRLTGYTPPGTDPNTVNDISLAGDRFAYVSTGSGVDLVDLVPPTGGPRLVRQLTPLPSSAARVSRSPRGLVMFFSYGQEGVTVLREALPGSGTRPAGTDTRFARVDLGAAGLGAPLTFVPAVRRNAVVEVMLQMKGAPVAARAAAVGARRRTAGTSTAASMQLRHQLQAQQDRIAPAIRRRGGTVVARLQTVYNGVQVRVRSRDVAALSTLPGVVAVHAMRPVQPANTRGAPFVGAPTAWGDHGVTGKGVRIGVIDSGIDYTHADFGGAGTAAAWAHAQESSTLDPSSDSALAAEFGPAAPKVKGGVDLVGDAYDAADPSSVPQPDPNPLDCGGHGTHVAGTAAGAGILDDGATFPGPYTADTIEGHDWKVGPGVAPEADLYAYRVFGCAGSSNVVAAAIDRAVADGMDVLNISLGSDLGGIDDPTTIAAENAAAAGVAVVAAAGNAGHGAYVTSSPATGSHVLSVAALDASEPTYPGAALDLTATDGGQGHLKALIANGAELPPGPLPVVVLTDGAGGVGLGCNPSDYDVPGIAGALVVTRRGRCARVARAVYGQQAGAAAVVMVNDDPGLPAYEGPITGNPDTHQPYEVTIPFLGVAGTAADAQALLAAAGGTVRLSATTVPNAGYLHTAPFSSAGPRNPDSAPKPEVVAPGVSVASAGVGTGSGFVVESGTSMATPMTTGVAALVKSAHPSWGGAQIKAAIQNTASSSLDADDDVHLDGAGVVQAQRAIDSSVLATTADGLDSLAFGLVQGSDDQSVTRRFTLSNTGPQAVTYALAVETSGNQRGAAVTVTPDTVTVAPGASETVSATLTMPAAALAALPSVDTTTTGIGAVTTVAGSVVATPTAPRPGQQSLRVTYLTVPRGLSDVQARRTSQFLHGAGSLPLRNTGVHAATVDVLAWGIVDTADAGSGSADVRAAGVASLPGAALGGAPQDRSLVFAVNSWGAAANRTVDEVDIAVDNNQDGWVDDFVVALDVGAVTTGSFTGKLATLVVDANTYEVIDVSYAQAPMNGSTLELAALASDLGIDPDFSRFDYTVTAGSLVHPGVVDGTETASADAFAPTASSSLLAPLAAGASLTLPLSFSNASQHASKDTRGWLVVAMDDANGATQADLVSAPYGGGARVRRLDSSRTSGREATRTNAAPPGWTQ